VLARLFGRRAVRIPTEGMGAHEYRAAMEAFEEILGAPFEVIEPTTYPSSERKDRVLGMVMGAALGDALGAPHEFVNQTPLSKYTGRLVHPLTVCRQFQGGRLTGGIGQVTDDTEMAIALATALLKKLKYDRDTVLGEYLAWANSKCTFMGRNTRALLAGVKTIKGYENRYEIHFADPQHTWSQSNGCLMRCAPLAALPEDEWLKAAVRDCDLTNPHPVCVCAVRAYIGAARVLLAGGSRDAATARAIDLAGGGPEWAGEAVVVAAIVEGRNNNPRDVTQQKGWVLHSLYCAFLALNDRAPSYQDRIDRIVRLGGDTDTNAAIAGALLGAQLGETEMRREVRTGPNLATVLEWDSTAGQLPRPGRYAAARLPSIAADLATL
jgi:ADP-ribosyl-[dinitrogen reductase] hydrolase